MRSARTGCGVMIEVMLAKYVTGGGFLRIKGRE
jgi:hypothetical protein